MTRALAVAVAVAVIGACGPGLTRRSDRNAPGDVDLDVAPSVERGDPAAYEPPQDPGEYQLGIAPGLWFMPGVGRIDPGGDAALELGVQLHLSFGERKWSGRRGALGYPFDSWGVTLGWALLQAAPEVTDGTTIGPIHVEAIRQWFLFSVAAGVAVYPTPGEVAGGRAGGVDVGGQITLSALAVAVRLRYMEDTGFEVFGGYQVYIPTSMTWSR